MSVTDRLRTWVLRGMVKAASLPVPFVPEWRRVQFISPTFRSLCQEGVRANGIVFNCLSEHVFAYPEARLRVYRETSNGLEPVPNHPLQALLDHPNPQMGQAELLQHIALYKPIGGSAYLYKVRSRAGKVVELLPLNDSQIRPVAGATLPIDHYEWTNEETGKDEKIPYDDVCQLKWMPDPLAPWLGLSPLVAVAREIDLDSEARRYLFALLKNNAIPPVVVTAPPGTKPFSPDEQKRYETMWAEKYGGDNRGKAAILGGGLDVKRIGMNLQELAFEALSKVPEARIAGSMRVPPVLAFLNVGLEEMTYDNVYGMRKQFTEGTMSRMWRIDADEISANLLPEFGGSAGLVVVFDTSKVAALQENVKELRTWANDALRSGGITRAQYLGYIGLPATPADDVYLLPFTMQVVPVRPPAPLAPPKALLPERATTKANSDRRQIMLALIAAQRQNRADVANRMESALDGWFGGLADRVIHRANQQAGKAQRKAMIDWEQLLVDSDAAEFEALVKRFYIELIQLSWDNWNVELGIDLAFDLNDPAVAKALSQAGTHVKEIQDTTLSALRQSAEYAGEQGWSIDHWVRGDPGAVPPVRGLRDIVEQTYKGRAKTIARTELGNAQQTAATMRYATFGVDRVLVMDNGVDDSAPQCVVLGNGGKGTIMPIIWAQSHQLGHPNCLRAFGAAFPDDGEIDQAAMQAWQEAGGDSAAIGGP